MKTHFKYLYLLTNEKTGERYIDYREYYGRNIQQDKFKSDHILRDVFKFHGKKNYKKQILCSISDNDSIDFKIDEYTKIHNAKSLYKLDKKIKPNIFNKKVICLNNMKLYANIKIVKLDRKIDDATLYKKLESFNGEAIACGLGEDNNLLIWMYYDEFLKNQDLSNKKNRLALIQEINNYNRVNNPTVFNRKPNLENPEIILNNEGYVISRYKKHLEKEVICLNTLEVFKTATNAALSCNCVVSGISHACRGRNLGRCGSDKDGNKLYWMLYKDIKRK
jgi:hypothetical protein